MSVSIEDVKVVHMKTNKNFFVDHLSFNKQTRHVERIDLVFDQIDTTDNGENDVLGLLRVFENASSEDFEDFGRKIMDAIIESRMKYL